VVLFGGIKMKNKLFDSLVIGDLHYISSRQRAIKTAEESIFGVIKGKKFKNIILLGDLFEKKPTAFERCLLADFLVRLRPFTETGFDYIVGNGRHTFEDGSIHEGDWIKLCQDFRAHEELTIDNFCFVHAEFKGTKYINGMTSQSNRIADKTKVYISGHIHSPICSFKNVNYVGSFYKTAFDQANDKKRIAFIQGNKIEWVEIASRPMYEIQVVGQAGKVKASGLKTLQESGDKEIDLKIKVMTDSSSLAATHRAINKIQEGFAIEYYQQEIKINEVKMDVPEDLDQDALLRDYCKKRNIDYTLVERELCK
jgi:hypothetical protein